MCCLGGIEEKKHIVLWSQFLLFIFSNSYGDFCLVQIQCYTHTHFNFICVTRHQTPTEIKKKILKQHDQQRQLLSTNAYELCMLLLVLLLFCFVSFRFLVSRSIKVPVYPKKISLSLSNIDTANAYI